MILDEPHLIQFFLHLKNELGLPLQIEDYKLLQKVWGIESLRPQNYDELKTRCQQLWGKTQKDQKKIGEAFDKDIKPIFEREIQTAITEKQSSNPSNFSQSSQTDLPTETQPQNISKQNGFIQENIDIDTKVVTAIPQPKKPQQKYILNDEYFPLSRVQLVQGWRSLRKSLRRGKEDEVDIPGTVKRICQENIVELVYYPSRENQAELLLLIDQSDSMIPFYTIAERLVKTAEGIFKSCQVFYFRNSPRNALFHDPELLEKESLDKILIKLHSTKTQVLIFSDGGATEIIPSEVRVELIQKFVVSLESTVQQIVWLNPLPEKDWFGTSAEKISSLVPMFPFSVLGWQEILQMLKGKTSGTFQSATMARPEIIVDDESSNALEDVLERESENNRHEEAIEILYDFADDFPAYLNLAFHGAFPLAITPDLLYYLRENFVADLPWIAVPDLLLSRLFESIGGKLYQMDSGVRHLLLKALKIRFGNDRLNELSEALLVYLQQGLEESIADAEELGENPDWIALGYTKPTELAKQLAQKLEKSLTSKNENKIKTASLVATFAEPLAELEFQPLLKLARGLARQGRGYEEGAQEIFEQLPVELNIEGVKLKVPGKRGIPLETFPFETVTVNPKGEIIHRETKQARYLTENIGKTTLEMVYIPGGSFTMGSPETEKDSYDDEKPQHPVTIKPFLMGKYPVTQAQWKAVAALPQINRELDPDPSKFKGDDRPVEMVSWDDAVEFCHRLSQYSHKTYRLPSEAEWEYACRAATITPFHFGETITTDLANYDGNNTYGQGPKGIYRQKTTPVGSFKVANAFGLYDMHGNVWEWCADHWYSNYELAPNDETIWLSSDEISNRLLRGGSWGLNPRYCRAAFRSNRDAGDRGDYLGFRVVCLAAWTL
ncbi:SUMF1/EgtB/PvdO family nonheme iron enzyme [Argonema antarcticum]|uniref:SUMF1/EgtB/PvdO family nonheme iron enzyme n=1 Tax=Argonema antarcticum TaxID=2942763 RepID=UPI0020126D14|nr:SUMF1/EgtB/PvdO family nonheme iron enzyme [Argonema antarcticum]MCL1472928.1 SUMF1/EgtB/PvdO family nonheme iron enzyme [Argonema antarcticum A004/B2]